MNEKIIKKSYKGFKHGFKQGRQIGIMQGMIANSILVMFLIIAQHAMHFKTVGLTTLAILSLSSFLCYGFKINRCKD